MNMLSSHLFWDVNRDQIDPISHASWLTQRVLEYGRWTDWQILVSEYGKPRLAELVTGLRTISPKSLAFCCAWFHLPKSAFRCSTSMQKIDLLRHAYPEVSPIDEITGHRLISVPDLAAMKLNAITNRGSKKDFYDLTELLQHHTLDEMLHFFSKKYHATDPFAVIRSLAWFEDAEQEPDPIPLAGQTWEKIKHRINQAVQAL